MLDKWYRISSMSKEEIREMQNQKLRDMIKYQIYPYSPFYRELFDKNKIDPDSIRTTDDLVKIPFITKEDIAPTADDPKKHTKIILQPDEEKIRKYGEKKKLLQILTWKMTKGDEYAKEQLEWEYKPIHIHFTTGRSAMPLPFVYTSRDLENLKESGKRLFNVFSLTKSDVLVNCFPYAPHLAFWQTYYGAVASFVTSLQSGGGKVMGTEKLINSIQKLKATVVTFIPGYAYHLLRKALDLGADFSNVRTVIFGGERVPPGLREKVVSILEKLGAKSPRVLVTYASTEMRVAWGECSHEQPTGYHTYPDLEFFEIINPKTGQRVKDGEEGEIVYTALDWRGSCVLRYRTGDFSMGGMTHEPCPVCGRTVPRISSNIQRKSDFREFNLTKVKGTLVNLNEFFPLMMGHPEIQEWQLEIRKHNDDPYGLDELYLYITPNDGVNTAELEEKLRSDISRVTEVTPNRIIFMGLQELLQRLGMETETKEKRLVDARPKL